VQDSVPRVKGIGGTPPENRQSSCPAKAKIMADKIVKKLKMALQRRLPRSLLGIYRRYGNLAKL
jgi:hypothetical protein